MQISFVSSVKGAAESIELVDYVQRIKSGHSKEYRQRIHKLIELSKQNPSKYKEFKATFPAVCPSGLLREGRSRKDSNVCAHTRLVSLDFDPVDNPIKLMDSFQDKKAILWHRSIGGKGLVVYFLTEVTVENHKDAFEYFSKYALDTHGLIADKQVSSVSTLRFIPFDKNVKFFPDRLKRPLPYEVVARKEDKADNSRDLTEDQEQLIELTEHLIKVGGNVVEERDEWVKVAAIYCRTFEGSAEGFELFNELSKLSKKYKNDRDCRKVYNSFKGETHHAKPSIASMLRSMKDNNIKPVPIVQIKQFKPVSERGRTKAKEEQEEKPTKKKKGLNWRDFLMTVEPDPEEPIVEINGVIVCSAYNHSVVLGKKKARKTLFNVLLAKTYNIVEDLKREALIVDTEQGAVDTWRLRERIRKATGVKVHVLHLRGISPEQRRAIISAAIEELKPRIVINDGIRDCMHDINDPKETTEVMIWLEGITLEGTHVVNVLHLNKTDENARGHIGTELLNKCETAFKLILDKKNDYTVVTCEASRGSGFEDFAFTHDMHGQPRIIDLVAEGDKDFNEVEIRAKIKDVFAGDKSLAYSQLLDEVKVVFALGDTRARQLCYKLVDKGVLKIIGKPRTASAKYMLV